MDLGFGGPVWHASAAWHGPLGLVPLDNLGVLPTLSLWQACADALIGVGDDALGAWRSQERASVHLRRRLTPEEWGGRPWGMDYRKTPEGEARLKPIAAALSQPYRDALLAEIR